MYTADENWKSHFKSLAVRACCILMQVDESISLSWELGI